MMDLKNHDTFARPEQRQRLVSDEEILSNVQSMAKSNTSYKSKYEQDGMEPFDPLNIFGRGSRGIRSTGQVNK